MDLKRLDPLRFPRRFVRPLEALHSFYSLTILSMCSCVSLSSDCTPWALLMTLPPPRNFGLMTVGSGCLSVLLVVFGSVLEGLSAILTFTPKSSQALRQNISQYCQNQKKSTLWNRYFLFVWPPRRTALDYSYELLVLRVYSVQFIPTSQNAL